jgi:hypothetical protein
LLEVSIEDRCASFCLPLLLAHLHVFKSPQGCLVLALLFFVEELDAKTVLVSVDED